MGWKCKIKGEDYLLFKYQYIQTGSQQSAARQMKEFHAQSKTAQLGLVMFADQNMYCSRRYDTKFADQKTGFTSLMQTYNCNV